MLFEAEDHTTLLNLEWQGDVQLSQDTFNYLFNENNLEETQNQER